MDRAREQHKNIASLKLHVERLLSLLNDPQPGLNSWTGLVHRQIKYISEYKE